MDKVTLNDILKYPKERIAKDYLNLLEYFESIPKNMEDYLKMIELFEKTEKWRLKYLNENFQLKKKLGKLFAVKKLMDSAEIYGYNDFIEEAGDFNG